jgi:hypothetical protein
MYRVVLNYLVVLDDVSISEAREFAAGLVEQIRNFYTSNHHRMLADVKAGALRSGSITDVKISAYRISIEESR